MRIKIDSIRVFAIALLNIAVISLLTIAVANAQPTPKAGTVEKNSLGMKFSYIPAGTFMMGSEKGKSNEKPVHQVTISRGFYLGVYEVTQEQWQKVMGDNPSRFTNCDQCPVERLSWKMIQEFIKKLNSQIKDGTTYRLPTEAEWEYAARAGTTGDYAGDSDSMAWGLLNSDKKTHPVGQKTPNAWGLYDMNGNVAEQVHDRYGKYPTGPVTDPTGPTSGSNRVYRSGSFRSQTRNLKSASRLINSPNNRYADLGVRLVMTKNN